MSPGSCPKCGTATEEVAGVRFKTGAPMVRCRACGWSSAERDPGWGGLGWLLWLGVGVLPYLAAPAILGLGERWERRDVATLVLVLGGLACCCFAGFGLSRVLGRSPLNQLVVGLAASGGFCLLNLTLGLMAGCGRP